MLATIRWDRPGSLRRVAALGLGMGLAVQVAAAQTPAPAPVPGAVPAAARALEPVAPVLPGEIVAALQEGRFDEAAAALDKLGADAKPELKVYSGLVAGIARKQARKLDAARASLQAALDAAPEGPWAAKVRSELAAVAIAAGRFQDAEALARAQAEALVLPARKDRLAGIYRDFAQQLLRPENPITPPDPEGAYALLKQARELAKGPALQAELLLAMAKASQTGGNLDRAKQDFQAYLTEYGKTKGAVPPADLAAARLGLGEVQLAAGDAAGARATWDELIRTATAPEQAAARALAMYQLSRTHGIPTPPDDTQLRFGVATLKRFLESYPAHPKAVRAAYEIGASYAARSKTQEALDAYRAFLESKSRPEEGDEARRDRAELSMSAAFEIGRLLQAQSRFDAAIAAYQDYLAKYPNGPQSAEAQRAILETRLAIAEDHEAHDRHKEARAVWEEFVVQNPLDPRVPELLYRIGASHLKQKPPATDAAIAAWETLAGKFPDSEPAGHAQFEIARIYEEKKGDPETAIDRYKKVKAEPWHSQAAQRIAVMEAKALTVVTPRPFRSGEAPHLEITSRNLEKLTFTAYKLNPEAYFRKKHTLEGVEGLDIGLVAPDAEWTVPVPGYARFKPVESKYELKLQVPGVFVVKVTDEKNLQATTLVLGSDLDAVVKTSSRQILVLAQDMKSGQGRPGARVLVSDGSRVVLDAKTGADGVLLTDWSEPRQGELRYLILDGADACGSGLGVPSQVVNGLAARAYLYTDRPAYRPGQTVELRGVVREIDKGQYAVRAGATYRLEVTDSRGRPFVSRPVTLSEFGTFHAPIDLDAAAAVGTYNIRVYQPGGSEFAGNFEVQAYQLQKIDLTFDLPRTVYYRGETVEGHLIAKYQYGTPLADRAIAVALPDGRTLQGRTDAAGRYAFSFATDAFAESQFLGISAQLPEDDVAAMARVALAVEGFTIALDTPRTTLLADEPFAVEVTTRDALGEPIGQELSVAVLKRIGGEVPSDDPAPPEQIVAPDAVLSEREISREKVATDPKTGKATVKLTVADADGGQFVIRASGTDRFGNPIVQDLTVFVSGEKDEDRLRFLADRVRYKVGEEASVRLHSRMPAGLALICWEADRILSYKLVAVKPGENAVAWAIVGEQFPNLTLTAAQMAGTSFQEARVDLAVERELRVTVKPVKEAVGPGDEVEVDLTVTDQLGRPVKAEIGLALIDRALLRRFADPLPPIGSFFYDQQRTGAFATEATNTFRYNPQTIPVAEAVVEEAARALAGEADAMARLEIAQRGQAQVQMAAPTPAPPATAAAPAMDAEPQEAEAKAKRRSDRAGGVPQNRYGLGMMGRPARDGRMSGQAGGMGGAMGSMGGGGFGAMGEDSSVAELGGADFSLNLFDSQALGVNGPASHFWAYSDLDEKQLKGAAVRPVTRQAFVETAYWNPAIVTDAQGKARVTFPAPSALSKYQFSARGVTGADTLVGQTVADLAVQQDFFADLKVPAILTEGDQPRFSARVHHTGLKGAVDLALKIYVDGAGEQVFPARLEVDKDGADEVRFDPFPVPNARSLKLTLTAKSGERSDEVELEVPVRPYGVQAYASASGTTSNDATAIVTLPPGRPYESPSMLITLSPTVKRMLVELALGQQAYPLTARQWICFPPPPATVVDRAGDLLAAASVLKYLQSLGGTAAPEAVRLTDRIRGIAAELVTLQNDDGGWPWVSPETGKALPSDPVTSARATWALAQTEQLALLSDPAALDRAVAYLEPQSAKTDAADQDTRAALLHALSTRRKASFESANALNRARASLSDVALAYLALTFANLERKELAAEVLGVLGPRAKTETVGPGEPPRIYWDGAGRHPGHRGSVEATALAALAFGLARPDAPEFRGATAWLLAHRSGNGWEPARARGPALNALAIAYGGAAGAEDRYRLVITVNDQEVHRLSVEGATEGTVIDVPAKLLQAGGANRVRFDVEGRATFGYAVTLTGFTREFGPDQSAANRSFLATQQIFMPAEPVLDGKTLPTGFGVAVNATYFENWAHQVELGGRLRVRVDAHRIYRAGQPPWEREFLVLQSDLPAGTTLVPGSIQTSAARHEIEDGRITFFFAPDQDPGQTFYDVFGYLGGSYRNVPPRIWNAYEPGQRHMAKAGVYDLKVLLPGEPKTDEYKPTPDELYARGKALFEAGRLKDAAAPLEALWGAYTLNDEVARESARMLLWIHMTEYDPRKVVQYFEILKEKHPDLIIPFDRILIVGRAYRDIGEFERAFLVWRTLAEASYLEDARLGETLRQRGRPLEAVALLLDLWRQYPNTASIESDFFGLSQLVANQAESALTDPVLRPALAATGKSRSDLLLQAIQLIQVFLSLSPRNPVADEASLALVGAFLELEDYTSVVKLSERFAKLYPKSSFLDSFQYSEALGRFHLGEYDRAIEVADAIAKATYKDANGVDQPSPNKWQALYIIGQIHDARRQAARAVDYYKQVADRFTDAAEAIRALTRKELTLPEVTVLRPGGEKVAAVPTEADIKGLEDQLQELRRTLAHHQQLSRNASDPAIRQVMAQIKTAEAELAAAGAIRNVRPAAFRPQAAGTDDKTKPDQVTLKHRNINEADVKVYPVDLLRLYLTRRNLDGIAGIDLAGITPLHESTVNLGSGIDLDLQNLALKLPLPREGAYLVMVRGDELYASGIALVTPLELEVIEEGPSGRVRVQVRNATTGAPMPKVQVKVIGNQNAGFFSGETDLRGVYVAEGVLGQVTAVARLDDAEHKDAPRYAFYRGTTFVGTPPVPAAPADPNAASDKPQEALQDQSLDENVKSLNTSNQMRQLERLQQRYNEQPSGGASVKGFK